MTRKKHKPRVTEVPNTPADHFEARAPEVSKVNKSQSTPPLEDFSDIPLAGIGDWSVDLIKRALQSHIIGNFAQSSLLTEAMLGDDRIQAALNGRTKAITARQLRTEPSNEPGGDQVAELVEYYWDRIFTEEILEQIMQWQTFLGFALCEIEWTYLEDDGYYVPFLKVWHPYYVWYRVDTRKYQVITSDHGTVDVDLNDPKWLLLTPFGSYRGWIRGAVRSCGPCWIVRQFARRDWARFSEIHGLPIKMIKSPAQADARDKARFQSQVSNMGSSSTISLPQQAGSDGEGWMLELLEAKDTSWQAFPGLIDHCNDSITLAIRGTNLTSQVQGGSYAAAQVHQDEDSVYADSDCAKLCERAEWLFRQFCSYNFGNSDLCPKLAMQPPDKADVKKLAETHSILMDMVKKARTNGWEMDEMALAQRFGVPLIEVTRETTAGSSVELAPTDQAGIITVNEAREQQGLAPLPPPEGDMSVTEYKERGKSNAEADAEIEVAEETGDDSVEI